MKKQLILIQTCIFAILSSDKRFDIYRKVGEYQRVNQNPYIEGHTTQWPNEKALRSNNMNPTKPGVYPGAPEGWSVPAPLVAP